MRSREHFVCVDSKRVGFASVGKAVASRRTPKGGALLLAWYSCTRSKGSPEGFAVGTVAESIFNRREAAPEDPGCDYKNGCGAKSKGVRSEELETRWVKNHSSPIGEHGSEPGPRWNPSSI